MSDICDRADEEMEFLTSLQFQRTPSHQLHTVTAAVNRYLNKDAEHCRVSSCVWIASGSRSINPGRHLLAFLFQKETNMQRSFSLKKQSAQTLEFQAIRSTAECNFPVSPRHVLCALVELLPTIPKEQLNNTIIAMNQRDESSQNTRR